SARTFSGSNYDQVSGRVGAGIVFRTNEADTLQIVRTPGSRNATLEICIDGAAACQIVAGTVDPLLVSLPGGGAHTVSITTITTGAFTLDAVLVIDGTLPLGVGVYEDNFPGLAYDPAASWTTLKNRGYSGGQGKQTLAQNATVTFNMEGSAFQVAGYVTQLNQMEVCWASGLNATTFPPTNCALVGAAPLGSRQIHTVNIVTEGSYTVQVRNTLASRLVLDYVAVFNSVDPLAEGRYEENHPKLITGRQGAGWSAVTGSAYSGGAAAQTSVANTVTDPGNALVFDFEGSGFEVSIPTGRFGSEVSICYEAGALSTFDPSENYSAIDGFCYTYQHETKTTVNTVTRSVNGLANGVYSVRVELRDENGSLFGTRSAANTPRLIIDYVTIFDTEFPLVPASAFEDGATDGADRYLQLSPTNRWTTITGRAAARFSNSSYAAVVDASGRVTSREAGAVAGLRVEVPANGQVTVILDTGTPSTRNPEKMLACFGNVSATTCQEITTMRTSNQQTYSITNSTGTPVEGVVTFRALTPGEFKIDSIQIIEGTVLTAGLYDEALPGSLIQFG
ncbi:MAG: hypothetical protein K8I30_15210, partial [Anaerolineae bacterium]|nr:hypothetical protein [Anaerolineae bacterium]